VNAQDGFDPAPVSNGSNVRDLIRLVGLFVVLLVLPMLLLAATVHPEGCGGG